MFYPPPPSELENDANLITEGLEQEIIIENIASLTPATVLDAPLKDRIEYKRYHLQKIAKWILNDYDAIAHNLNTKTAGNEDLTFSVSQLLGQINTDVKERNYNDLEVAVNAFVNIGDQSWYPSLRLLDVKSIDSRTADGNPLVIVEDANEQGETFRAYELGPDGEPYETDEPPTEENTQGRNFVIVELGTTDCNGNQKCNDGDIGSDTSGGGGSGGGGTNTGPTLRIQNMTIRDLKETWPGRPEIHIKAYAINANDTTSGFCGINLDGGSNCFNIDGNRIKRIRRSDRNDQFSPNYLISQGDLIVNGNQYVFFTIFESDSFPALERTADFNFPNNTQRSYKYRSWNSDYHSQTLATNPNNPFGIPALAGFVEDDDDIKFNLTFSNF